VCHLLPDLLSCAADRPEKLTLVNMMLDTDVLDVLRLHAPQLRYLTLHNCLGDLWEVVDRLGDWPAAWADYRWQELPEHVTLILSPR
jgi:hypothetical protein